MDIVSEALIKKTNKRMEVLPEIKIRKMQKNGLRVKVGTIIGVQVHIIHTDSVIIPNRVKIKIKSRKICTRKEARTSRDK